MSCTAENKDVSSAKSFALDEIPSLRSLMEIRNNKGPSMTPALTFVHIKNCPLRTTRCFLLFKKSRKRFSNFPVVPF